MDDFSDLPQQELNLRDYVRILFRQKLVIIVTFAVVMITAFVGVLFKTPVYEAKVKMLVTGSKQVEAPYYKDLNVVGQSANLTQSEIAKSDPVIERAVYALHLFETPLDYEKIFASPLKHLFIKFNTKILTARLDRMSERERSNYLRRRAIEDLRAKIKTEPIKDTNIFTISVSDYNPVAARVVANVISRSYVIFDLEQQVAELQLKYGAKHPMVLQLMDTIRKMNDSLSGKTLTSTEAIGPASVKIIEQAGQPLAPEGKPNSLILLIAFFGSLFLGSILAFIFDYTDQTIKSPRDVEKLLKLPALGFIPKARLPKEIFIEGKINKNVPRRFVMAYQDLSNQLLLLRTIKPYKTIYLATADSKDGQALMIANLGYQLAEHGAKKVLIVDANFRHSGLHKIFKHQIGPGLVDVLIGSKQMPDVIRNVSNNLAFLPAGTTHLNPVTFLNSVQMLAILESLKHQYDCVLVCCSELKSYQDGYMLSTVVDQTIFVVTENETRRQVAMQELEALREHKVKLMGCVLDKRTYPIPSFVYKRV